MSRTCATEEGEKCGSCGGHGAAMLLMVFVALAVIVGAAALFIGK